MQDLDEQREDPREPSPVNPLPPIVILIFLAIFFVEVMFAAGEAGLVGGPTAIGWRFGLIEQYGFSPDILAQMMERNQYPAEHLLRFVTYPFFHLGFVHMAIAVVIFLAMGKMVGEVMGQLAIFVMFFAGSALGALIYGMIGEPTWLVGAYPGAYALIGGFTFILWSRARILGHSQSQAFSLIAILMGIQLIFGLVFGADNLWLADLGGFITGFLLCFVLVPGAMRALLARLRQR